MKIPHTAMVLAAGLGTRMRPLTNDRPKPLVEIGGRALVDHLLDRLIEAGVQRAVVNVHYRADQMEAHLASRHDIEIVISDERERLMETGGGVRQALSLLGDDPIFICNTDAIWEEHAPGALAQLASGFDPARMGARLMIVDRANTLGFDGAGDFHCDVDGRLRHRGADAGAQFAYTGVQIADLSPLHDEPLEPFSFMRIWRELQSEGRLFGAGLDGFWMHVGDPQAVTAAEAHLAARGPRL